MKDTFYFTHDYNARFDSKIKKLIRVHGMLGYGIYWAIIEDLYNNANALQLDCDGIAFELRVDAGVVESIIQDFDLFIFEGGEFGSLSVQRRLNDRNSKSQTARNNSLKRWNKMQPHSNGNATAMQPHQVGNAIKERKGKEIKERKKEFEEKVAAFGERYTKQMLNEFCNYWTEHSDNGKKMRFEKQTVFDVTKRLTTWAGREKKYSSDKKGFWNDPIHDDISQMDYTKNYGE